MDDLIIIMIEVIIDMISNGVKPIKVFLTFLAFVLVISTYFFISQRYHL